MSLECSDWEFLARCPARAAETSQMTLSQSRRHNQLDQGLPGSLRSVIAEGAFRRRVPADDTAIAIDTDKRLGSSIEHRGPEGNKVIEGLVGHGPTLYREGRLSLAFPGIALTCSR